MELTIDQSHINELKQRHSYLNKRVAKMERERARTRDINHKLELKEMKKEKLLLKDKIEKLEKYKKEYNFDEHQGGVETFR